MKIQSEYNSCDDFNNTSHRVVHGLEALADDDLDGQS